MPGAAHRWYAPPTRPMQWDEANPLAHGLASLLYFSRGSWQEGGPYGGNVQASRVNTGSDYKTLSQGLGRIQPALYGTTGATSGDGFRFIYPGNIVNTTDPITVFGLGYAGLSDVNRKPIAIYSNGSFYTARVMLGTSALAEATVEFQHAGSLVSSARTGSTYVAGQPYLISASKSPQTAVAPLAYVDGALAGTTVNQNAAWIAATSEVYVGRLVAATAATQLNGGAVIFGLFNRMLTDEEHQALYENPWQLLKPTRSARIFDFATAAAVAGQGTLLGGFRNRSVRHG